MPTSKDHALLDILCWFENLDILKVCCSGLLIRIVFGPQTTQQTQPTTPAAPPAPRIQGVHITFGADAVMLCMFVGWFLYKTLIADTIAKKLDGVFAPVQEERRISTLLAQIGILTRAHRVLVTAFHNGTLDQTGYHLQKISTTNQYLAQGAPAMAKPLSNLPIGRIMYELEELLSTDDWVEIKHNPELPPACREHLEFNSIKSMQNCLIKVGNLPIGILSIQYTTTMNSEPVTQAELNAPLLKELVNSISAIMRRRVVHPGPLKKFLAGMKSFKP
jgi:hypothetical protein